MTDDELAGCFFIDSLPLAHSLDAVVKVGCDKDIHDIGILAQHIVCSTSHEDTVALVGSLFDGIALKLVQSFLREIIVIKVIVAQKRQMGMEKRLEKAFLLIVLFEELLGEPAFLGCKVD